ncbi:hypothetical protein B0H34DRAFT_692784 [Crassisporium funariophilum]|nr:hypothetical protein B0H34DRAFT_692784 [Crassisporium funariophilum]
MKEITLKECHICRNDRVPLKNFRFFVCGHRMCCDCEKHSRANPLCGECRKPKQHAHQIYLDLEDIVDDDVGLVVDFLDEITVNSTPAQVQSASHRFRNSIEHNQPDADTYNSLLAAANNLEDRISPLFKQHSEIEKANEALLQRVNELQSHNQIYKEKARRSKGLIIEGNEEISRLQLAFERQRSANASKDKEIKQLEAKLTEQEKELKLGRIKLRALLKSQIRKRTAQDPDVSLIVEAPLEDSNRRHLKRRGERISAPMKQDGDILSPNPSSKRRKGVLQVDAGQTLTS